MVPPGYPNDEASHEPHAVCDHDHGVGSGWHRGPIELGEALNELVGVSAMVRVVALDEVPTLTTLLGAHCEAAISNSPNRAG
jgi:hypothetical protein